MAGAEHVCQHHTQYGRNGSDSDRPQERLRNLRPQRLVPYRDVRADDEHHQCKPDIGQQREGHVGVIDDPKARLSNHQPGEQFADDHRDPEARQRGEQRPGHPYDRKQRQCVEAEPGHFGGVYCQDTKWQGMFVFSSVR